jgi:hypothetical protein
MLEGSSSPVGSRKRLGRQVLSESRTYPPGDEPVDRLEVLVEGGFEVLGINDAMFGLRSPSELSACHVYVCPLVMSTLLSRLLMPFPEALNQEPETRMTGSRWWRWSGEPARDGLTEGRTRLGELQGRWRSGSNPSVACARSARQ